MAPIPPSPPDDHEVDWAGLEHAYGPATDIPDLLALLLSPHQKTRRQAGEKLADAITHNDQLYSATAAVAPFLLRLLAAPTTPDREYILGYLASLSQVTCPPHHSEAERDTRAALRAGLPIFLDICEQESPLRGQAAYTLGWFQEEGPKIAPRLRSILAAEANPGVQVALLLALADLLDRNEVAQRFFTEQMQQATSKAVAFVAAAALIDHTREQAPDEAVAIIMETIEGVSALALRPPTPEEVNDLIQRKGLFGVFKKITQLFTPQPGYWEGDPETRYGPFWHEDGLTAALAALAKLGSSRAIPLLAQVLPRLPQGEQAIGLLLELAFDRNRGSRERPGSSLHGDGYLKVDQPHFQASPPVEALTAEQRIALQALLAYPPLWELDPARNPLGDFGLPTHRELLRHLLEGPILSPLPPAHLPDASFLIGDEAPLLPDHLARVQRLEQMMRQAGYTRQATTAISDYLKGQTTLEESWLQSQDMQGTRWFGSEAIRVISEGEFLDRLDLRLLDIFLVLGFAELFLAHIARQQRVAQAFAQMQSLQEHHPAIHFSQSALAALALVREGFVYQGHPTPLGQLILAGLPERAYEVLQIRHTFWGRFERNAGEIIDLLLAARPPYSAEALRLGVQARRDEKIGT